MSAVPVAIAGAKVVAAELTSRYLVPKLIERIERIMSRTSAARDRFAERAGATPEAFFFGADDPADASRSAAEQLGGRDDLVVLGAEQFGPLLAEAQRRFRDHRQSVHAGIDAVLDREEQAFLADCRAQFLGAAAEQAAARGASTVINVSGTDPDQVARLVERFAEKGYRVDVRIESEAQAAAAHEAVDRAHAQERSSTETETDHATARAAGGHDREEPAAEASSRSHEHDAAPGEAGQRETTEASRTGPSSPEPERGSEERPGAGHDTAPDKQARSAEHAGPEGEATKAESTPANESRTRTTRTTSARSRKPTSRSRTSARDAVDERGGAGTPASEATSSSRSSKSATTRAEASTRSAGSTSSKSAEASAAKTAERSTSGRTANGKGSTRKARAPKAAESTSTRSSRAKATSSPTAERASATRSPAAPRATGAPALQR